ncbi:MAG: hypothetical protein EOP84_32290, partial [Verrucomicrobiaceae bacterium]
MTTFTCLLVGTLLVGSTILQAQEPERPNPAAQSTTEETARVTSADTMDNGDASADAKTTEAEVQGPPAPPADQPAKNGSDDDDSFEFNYESRVGTPEASYKNGKVTYDPGKFVYKVQRKD